MAKKGANIALSGYDDIFGVSDETVDVSGAETVQDIDIANLHPFKSHPFKVKDDEEMEKTVESILKYGVLTPAIVRPRDEGGYEIISGHRRCHASQLAGIDTLPCIVRNLDDDAATILMVDANLQREHLDPSERAWALKMKLDAITRTKGRPKNVGQVVPDYFRKRSTEVVAEGTGESYKQIQRYIRLTELIPELLEMVDSKEIAFNPAVELSFLSKDEQTELLDAMDYSQATPSLSQAQRLKKLSQSGECTLEAMCEIMSEEKKKDLDRVTLNHETLSKYFPKSYTPKQMEETIVKLLEEWQKKRERTLSK